MADHVQRSHRLVIYHYLHVVKTAYSVLFYLIDQLRVFPGT